MKFFLTCSIYLRYDIKDTPEAREFFTFLGTVTYENMMETPIYDKVPANKWLDILYDLKRDIGSNILSEKSFDPYETWIITEKGLCFVSRNVFAVYATLKLVFLFLVIMTTSNSSIE